MTTSSVRKIAVASDFGESSQRALDLALDLARSLSAELVIVHSVEPIVTTYPIALVPDQSVVDAAVQEDLDAEAARVRSSLPLVATALLHGRAVDEIAHFVEGHRVDLLVLGTHGRSGPSRWLLGSVAEKIVRASRVPVLTVPSAPNR